MEKEGSSFFLSKIPCEMIDDNTVKLDLQTKNQTRMAKFFVFNGHGSDDKYFGKYALNLWKSAPNKPKGNHVKKIAFF